MENPSAVIDIQGSFIYPEASEDNGLFTFTIRVTERFEHLRDKGGKRSSLSAQFNLDGAVTYC